MLILVALWVFAAKCADEFTDEIAIRSAVRSPTGRGDEALHEGGFWRCDLGF